MTPSLKYADDLKRDDFSFDPAQENAVAHLQRLYDDLIASAEMAEPERSFFSRVKSKFSAKKQEKTPPMGLYFWGGVGRGKTYLVDTFHDLLPFEEKQRIHFHRFMQQVHAELRSLDRETDPLAIVAERIAGRVRIICFDEFHVSDIADAMLLGRLFEYLFSHGVALVATSNLPPDNLYKNGLQRERFLPAIGMIKQFTTVVNVDNEVDYRLRELEKAEIYHSPLDQAADDNLCFAFEHVAPEVGTRGEAIDFNNRDIATVRAADGIIWFEFSAICEGYRSIQDYIEIARCCHTVLIANVRVMDKEHNDTAMRFINMVDEFYDRKVSLVISAEVPITELYQGTKHQFPFQRTESRLLEMQSHDYLMESHLP